MLGAAPAAVRFGCPTCGGWIRASLQDGGSTIVCYQCGEKVRVPRHPHPVESADSTPSHVPVALIRQFERGIGYLRASIVLFVIEHTLLVLGVSLWLVSLGPARLVARDAGTAVWLLALLFLLDTAFLTIRTGLRWLGYEACKPLVQATISTHWLVIARWATFLRGLSYFAIIAPWFGGFTASTLPLWLNLLTQLGMGIWLCATAMEFGVLLAWHRFAADLGATQAVKVVTRYGLGVLAGCMTVLTFASVTELFLILTLRKNGSAAAQGPRPRIDLASVPQDGWQPILGLMILAFTIAIALALYYDFVLRQLRHAVRSIGNPASRN